LANRVIVIVGPTAVGKSEFAIKLAKEIRGEIISADSMQAYKGMGIISQGPTTIQQRGIPHHLLSFLSPEKEYSAAMFARLAGNAIQGMIKRGKVPIIAGGSGLYVKALIDGIFPSRGKDLGLRKKLRRLARKKGSPFLHERLKKIDPPAAEKIHPNDLKKIIRALEIYEVEKKTKTSLKQKTRSLSDKYNVRLFGLTMERKRLYERINSRVDSMFRDGIIKEVKRLLRLKLSVTSRQALGIKELEGYLNKEYGLDRAKEVLKRGTRRFAKRQFTWFRADKRIRWIDITEEGEKEVVEEIASPSTNFASKISAGLAMTG